MLSGSFLFCETYKIQTFLNESGTDLFWIWSEGDNMAPLLPLSLHDATALPMWSPEGVTCPGSLPGNGSRLSPLDIQPSQFDYICCPLFAAPHSSQLTHSWCHPYCNFTASNWVRCLIQVNRPPLPEKNPKTFLKISFFSLFGTFEHQLTVRYPWAGNPRFYTKDIQRYLAGESDTGVMTVRERYQHGVRKTI